jgi:poly(hydroxyalkanoate) depolymerase family esterase
MTSISDTIKRLAALGTVQSHHNPGRNHLPELNDFGPNAGNLVGKIFVPQGVGTRPALVVVLHGCTQSAESYDRGSGWTQLAARHGFVVLFPEQRRQNNPNLCFNWFKPGDIRRDGGEASSIRQMIEATCIKHRIDSKQVFITGLSAGGAMATVMLATYPEVFSAGAIVAGLPHGVASSIPQALERMRGIGLPSGAELSDKVREASSHSGPWPTVSIWQGSRDHTVAEANAHALVEQWLGLHGLSASSSNASSTDGPHHTTRWSDGNGLAPVEFHSIDGMGHGTPIDIASGLGASGPFMLDVGISSTAEIARTWGLTASLNLDSRGSFGSRDVTPRQQAIPANGLQEIIEKALRSAGLMR